MTRINWTALRKELALWHRDGATLPLWWRDDDAIEPTPQLDRLRELAEKHCMPVHLAVIPANAKPTLTADISDGPFRAVVHGWAHKNHAPEGMKSSEFGTRRAEAFTDAKAALARLRTLFGDKVYPMFVPPWNRIEDDLIARLPDAGYSVLSTYLPRQQRFAAPGIEQINTHIDPVDWRGTRGLAEPEMVLDKLVTNLQDRRTGTTDASEPLGLLTHHLMQDDPTWDFTHALLTELCEGPVSLFDIATRKDTP